MNEIFICSLGFKRIELNLAHDNKNAIPLRFATGAPDVFIFSLGKFKFAFHKRSQTNIPFLGGEDGMNQQHGASAVLLL